MEKRQSRLLSYESPDINSWTSGQEEWNRSIHSFIEGLLSPVTLVIATCCVLVSYLSSGELSVPILFAFCFCVGVLVTCLVMGTDGSQVMLGIKTFTISYSINVVLVILLEEYYQSEYGRPFLWNSYAPGYDATSLIQYARGIIKNSSVGVHDDLKFHIVGIAIARDWINGSDDSGVLLKQFSYVGYPWLVGGIMYVANFFGDMSALAPRMVNCMFGGLLVVSILALAASTYGLTVGKRAVAISITLPLIGFYSANTFRDIIVAFFVVVSTLLINRLSKPSSAFAKSGNASSLIVCGTALLLLRSPTLYTLLAAYALYFSMFGGGLLKRMSVGLLLLGLLVALIVNVEAFSNQTLDYLSKQGESWNESRIMGGTKESLAIKYIYNTPPYVSIPMSTIYMIFMPVPPFNSLSLPGLLEGISALTWYFFVPFWIFGLWSGVKNREVALVAITCIVLFLSVAYVGGALRHKIPFMVLGFIHVSYALEVLWVKKNAICLGTLLMLLVSAGVYGVLKF